MCGLSHKQMWRKCLGSAHHSSSEGADRKAAIPSKCQNKDTEESDFCNQEMIFRTSTAETEVDQENDSADRKNPHPLSIENPSNPNLMYSDQKVAEIPIHPSPKKKKHKKVSFHSTVKVVLIPCVEDYKRAQLMSSLWWTPQEIRQFEVNMIRAVRDYMHINCCDDYKEALTNMTLECGSHQPPPISSPPPAVPKSVRNTLAATVTHCKLAGTKKTPQYTTK